MKKPSPALLRLLKLSLILYPRRFREEWADEILQTVISREKEIGTGPTQRMRFWSREFMAVLRTGLRLRIKGEGDLSSPATLRSKTESAFQMGDRLLGDLRFAIRQLLRRPALAGVAVLTLALGIGANTAVFSVVRGALIEPLPYPEPDRLVRVFDEHTGFPLFPMNRANFLDYRARDLPFSDIALYVRADLQLAEEDRPEQLTGMAVSSEFFRVLGMEPILGRGFTRENELEGNESIIVLGHHIWSGHFHSDPAILGRTLILSGRPFTVVGVAPPDLRPPGGVFRTVDHNEFVDIWWPLVLDPGEQRRGSHNVNGIARLRDGIGIEAAELAMKVVAAEVAEPFSDDYEACTAELVLLSEDIVGHARPMLLVLLGAAGLILLIACVNVAGVMLARAAERRGEIAVRVAIGAGQGHLIRQMLVEGSLVAILGGVAGVGVSVVGLSQLLALAPEGLPRLYSIGLNGEVLAFAVVATGFTALFAGLAPAFHARSFNVANTLQSDGGRTVRRAVGSRRFLVVAQSALAVMLLVGAGLLLRSFNQLQRVDPGFEPEGVITAGFSLPGARYARAEEVNRFQSDLLSRIRSLPQVQAAGLANALPWSGFDENAGFEIEGWTPPPGLLFSLRYHFVSPGYFESIGVPIESGRPLYESDDSEATPVVLINASMARQYWTDHPDAGEPLGAVIHFWGNEWTVVGIVGDVKDGPREAEAEPAAFAPLKQISRRNVSLTVRAVGDPQNMVAQLRQTLAEVDPAIPLTNIRTLDEITAGNTAEARFMALLVGLFAAVALLLAVVGIYGLMTYMVGQRNREIAVRMALGAEAPQVVRSVVLEGISLAGAGLVVGLVASLGLTRLLTALLFGVSPFDPLTLLVAGAGLVVVAGASCFLPARKAAGVHPMEAMR